MIIQLIQANSNLGPLMFSDVFRFPLVVFGVHTLKIHDCQLLVETGSPER